MCENQEVIAVHVPDDLVKIVHLLGESYTVVEVSFDDLFGSLYASWKLVKDNPEELKDWSKNVLLVLQGDSPIRDSQADGYKEAA